MPSLALTIGKLWGIPIRVHLSLPLGLLMLTRFQWRPLWWLCSLGVVLLHELGHAAVVRAVGAKVTEVMLTGFGGHCGWDGTPSKLGRAAISCGGIAAQLLLLFAALGAEALHVVPAGEIGRTVFWAATESNIWLIGINLVPMAPLDGAIAWTFPYLLGQRARQRLAVSSTANPMQPTALVEVEDPVVAERAKARVSTMLEDARKAEDEP
jgi:Zn-dependent protease